jgi:hypothetical protein
MCLAAFSSAQNLVQNGDFETGFWVYDVENQGLPGWTVLGDHLDDQVSIYSPNPPYGFTTNHLDLSGFSDAPNIGVEQIVPTVTGQTYHFAFDYYTGGGIFAPGDLNTIDVFVNGVQLFDELNSGDSWDPYSYSGTFVATGPTTIRFLVGDLPTINDIDNVVVESVPEPAPFAALGLGLLALAHRRKNRA